MGIKRIVDTGFWTDDKVMDMFSPEDKLFFLYLMTNPHSTQLGIYHVNRKSIAFEIGYSVDAVSVLIDRFETKYKMIRYSNDTNEIAIKNYLKHSIIKGGKPVEDLLKKEISAVKDKSLLRFVHDEISGSDLNISVEKVLPLFIDDNESSANRGTNRGVTRDNENENENENEKNNNNNNAETEISIFNIFESELGRPLSPMEIDTILGWQIDHSDDLICEALNRAVLNDKRNFAYIRGILDDWLSNNVKSLDNVRKRDKERTQKKGSTKNERSAKPVNPYEGLNIGTVL